MMAVWVAILGIVGGYLMGSISSAILVCRLMHLPDPRTQGSGNPGATNVLRVGGKRAGAFTLIGDVLKGFLPVLIIRAFTDDLYIISAVYLAAMLGHIFPIFFKFKGGKGVATLIGGLAALSPLLCGIFLVFWLTVFAYTRLSSLSALVATGTMPIAAWFWADRQEWLVLMFIAILVFWRHQSNIRALLAGTETKSTFKV